ncbi:MAG: aminoacetone oxidase family FAD-binding enzyme [Clostridiales bacterium]|nr:aminoacetone oxidase family FAD-binding enzyme [Candidatus Crickella merdequi]
MRYDIAVIGAGPAGMTAALEALRLAPELNVLVIEKNAEAGKKLRATGSGRCNITNTGAEGYDEARVFLERLGIALRIYDNGLVYPYSESAADVAELFADRMEECGVELLYNACVNKVERNASGFAISYETKVDGITSTFIVEAGRLVLACGGKSGPGFGTTGDGYRWARELGHKVISPIPVLTSVECEKQGCENLGGNRARGEVSLWKDGEKIFAEAGEIQFTRYGLSGICVFNMTRFMRSGSRDLSMFEIKLDLYEGYIRAFLGLRREEEQKRVATYKQGETAESLLRSVLKEAIARYVLERADVDRELLIAELSDEELDRVAACVHGPSFRPSAVKGWKDAQCTSGGVALEEFDEATCESKLVPGMYVVGELADYDGPCGGYNLTYAWISGMKAGRAIAE